MTNPKPTAQARYFRAPIETARAIKEETGDPDALAAWLVMRRFNYGHKRELTCAGAKKVAAALGISRPRATRIIESLLSMRFGEKGEGIALTTADDWNTATDYKVPRMKGNAPVYVTPDTGTALAYLPDLLIPHGEARSPLARLCELDAALGLDCLHLLLLAYHAVSCADYVGAAPGLFASEAWTLDADETGDNFLGHLGVDQGVHYWLAAPAGKRAASWSAIELLTGASTEECSRRYWLALETLLAQGHLFRVAIVSDARDRLHYPLHVFGEGHRSRLAEVGVMGVSRELAKRAQCAGIDMAEARFESDGSILPDVYTVATRSESPPVLRTVYVPTLTAPTPENLAGLERVATLCAAWH